ncbi:DMT family transporter [Rheinheimera soli]|uniref:Drug/metabolite transporter (DMT)-like permease n=1 Tax=Rheinheimera soli TaxID=443616 RepID=A0ABU1W420_9GAMM|nr:DMT family transporter [Rheinheimera soli]MDR7122580.1 drug/metabolite transporter (DMT)-like permease [Rheinheimera soli]
MKSLLHPAVDQPTKGILCMLLAVGMFCAMDACMKQLTQYYAPMQITSLRALFAWPLIVIWLVTTNRVQHLLNSRWSLHLFRAVLGIVMLSAFVYAIQTLSLADAYAIFFAAPLLITAMSVWFLGEHVQLRQWVAISIGMLAVLFMLKPEGDQLLSLGALAALVSALCYAISAITVRVLSRTDNSGNMVFWLMTMIGLGAGALAYPQWVSISLDHLWLLALMGLSGAIGQVFITEAFRLAPASVIAPFEYTALVWGLGFDILLWQLFPGLSMLIGAGVIMACGLYLWVQERR